MIQNYQEKERREGETKRKESEYRNRQMNERMHRLL